MSARKEDLEGLSHAALVEIAFQASVALSRSLDHEGKPGFPPGECAWAMARDLRKAFDLHGVTVEAFGAGVQP